MVFNNYGTDFILIWNVIWYQRPAYKNSFSKGLENSRQQASDHLTHDGAGDLRHGAGSWRHDTTIPSDIMSHTGLTGRCTSDWLGRGAVVSFQVLWWNTLIKSKLGEGKLCFILQGTVIIEGSQKRNLKAGLLAVTCNTTSNQRVHTPRKYNRYQGGLHFSPHNGPVHSHKKII